MQTDKTGNNKVDFDEKEYQKKHDQFVDFRDKFLDVGPRFFVRKRIVLKLLEGTKGKLVDVGCGEGVLLRELLAMGYKCLGLDVSQEAIEKCRIKLHTYKPEVMCSAIEEFDPTEKLDVAVCSEVIEHIKHDEPFVRQINRIMKPGATLIASVPLDMKLWSKYDEQGHYRRYTKEGFIKLLEDAGFQIEETVVWGYPLMRSVYQWIRAPQYYTSVKKGGGLIKQILVYLKPILRLIKYSFLVDNLFNFTEKGVGIVVKAHKVREVV